MSFYKIISFLAVLALLFGFGYFFKDNIVKSYKDSLRTAKDSLQSAKDSLQNFEKNGLDDIINEIERQILAPPPLAVGGKESDAILTRARIIAKTNIQRYNNDMVVPLIENPSLNKAAKAKAEDMLAKQYFEHVSPSGVDPGQLVKNAGYQYIITGENLILGNFASEAEMVQDWMDSPGHRANILHERFTDIGAAVVKGAYQGRTVWIGVQEFGLPLSVCQQPNASLRRGIDFNIDNLSRMSAQIEVKKAEIESTNPRSPRYNEIVDEYNQMVSQYNALNQETKNLIFQYNDQVSTFNQCVTGDKQ